MCRASSNAAFDTAVVYFRAGRELLGVNAWDDDTNTMVALCSEEANACFVIRDLEQMNSLIDEVLSKDIPIKLKFKANETKILALNAAGKVSFVDEQCGATSSPNISLFALH